MLVPENLTTKAHKGATKAPKGYVRQSTHSLCDFVRTLWFHVDYFWIKIQIIDERLDD
jgi:hypothetical protein